MTVFTPDEAVAFLEAVRGDRLEALYGVMLARGDECRRPRLYVTFDQLGGADAAGVQDGAPLLGRQGVANVAHRTILDRAPLLT
jgi:hypothetical protein